LIGNALQRPAIASKLQAWSLMGRVADICLAHH